MRDILVSVEEDRFLEFTRETERSYKDLLKSDPEAMTEQDAKKAENDLYGHIELLVDEGAIRGVKIDADCSGNCWQMSAWRPRLTTSGFDLLDALNSKTIWKKARESAVKYGIPLTFELLKETLRQATKLT